MQIAWARKAFIYVHTNTDKYENTIQVLNTVHTHISTLKDRRPQKCQRCWIDYFDIYDLTGYISLLLPSTFFLFLFVRQLHSYKTVSWLEVIKATG